MAPANQRVQYHRAAIPCRLRHTGDTVRYIVNRLNRLAFLIAIAGTFVLNACGGGSSSPDTTTMQFGPPTTSALGTDKPGGLVFGDFNSDGKQDFLNRGQPIIYVGQGDGSFRAAGAVAGGFTPWVAADFNGDGKLDIAGCVSLHSVAVALGNGDGTFRTPIESPVPGILSGGIEMGGCEQYGVAVGDFDGDGKADLIVPLNGNVIHDSGVVVLFGNGDGTFRAGLVQVIATGRALFDFAVSDLDRDGKLDLLVTTLGNSLVAGGSMQIHLGRGDGTFGAPLYPSLSGIGQGIPSLPAIADFNGDGTPDFALTAIITHSIQIGFPSAFSIFPGNGDGTFRASTYGFDTTKVRLTGNPAAGDLNGDGNPDLALSVQLATPEAPSTVLYRLRILYGNGDGTMGDPVDYPLQTSAVVERIIDVNGDGLPDVVLLSGTDVIVFPNTSRRTK